MHLDFCEVIHSVENIHACQRLSGCLGIVFGTLPE